jgi:hypothetical protein
MMVRRFSFGFLAFALVAAMLFTGCDPEKDDVNTDPPVDSDPLVTLLSPVSGYALVKKGESISISFEIHDNELLTTWEATDQYTSVSGVVYQPETRITGQYAAISTQNQVRTIQYTVPDLPSVQVYSTIDIRAYATDNKGKRAIAKFRINVLPNDSSATAYSIQEYTTSASLFTQSSGGNYTFDLINFTSGTNSSMPVPNMYLREVSVAPNNDFVFESPIWGATDSVLVTTNQSVFNYDDLTYETMWQAFVTSNRIGRLTDPLQLGDIVILKLPNLPHYAAIKVQGISPSTGEMTFVYKYSY